MLKLPFSYPPVGLPPAILVSVQAVDDHGPPGLINRDPNLRAVLSLSLEGLITSRSKLAPSGSSQLIGTETFPHCISEEIMGRGSHSRHTIAWVELTVDNETENTGAAARSATHRKVDLVICFRDIGILEIRHGGARLRKEVIRTQ
jgi:hypothetical protein